MTFVNSTTILYITLIPVIGAFLLPILGRLSEKIRNAAAFLFVFIPLCISCSLIPYAFSKKCLIFNMPGILGINFNFTADPLAVFMAATCSLISLVIVVYSIDYISHYPNRNEYYLMVVLFFGAMMGLIFSSNLVMLFVFWEITGITSWRLIGFFRGEKDVIKADKAFLITVFGALVMLVGFVMLAQYAGSFDLETIKMKFRGGSVPDLIVLLIFIGMISKSATLPFHTWLPDAGVAPSPVTALLHAAILVKIGVYVFARLFVIDLPISQIWQVVVPLVCGISALVSAGAAFLETDLKRLIAYSTISQIGFIFLGLSTGNPIGIAGGLLYILMHGMAKGGLFLCAGIIEQNAKTKDITKMGGLFSAMPVTAVSFLLCAFSVMGIPPFGGFWSKFMVFAGAARTGHMGILLIYVIAAFMTVMYLFRAFNMIFMGDAKITGIKENGKLMVSCVAILAFLSLAAGFLIKYPNDLLGIITQNRFFILS